MNLGLLDRQELVLRCIGGDQHRKHLADADADVPVAHGGAGALVDENEILKGFGTSLDQFLGPAFGQGLLVARRGHEFLDLGDDVVRVLRVVLGELFGNFIRQRRQIRFPVALPSSEQRSSEIAERLVKPGRKLP